MKGKLEFGCLDPKESFSGGGYVPSIRIADDDGTDLILFVANIEYDTEKEAREVCAYIVTVFQAALLRNKRTDFPMSSSDEH